MKNLIVIFTILLTAALAQAGPERLSVSGKIILKGSNQPLVSSNVSFNVKIFDPTGSCIVYQEQINTVNMSESEGAFDLILGQGTRTYPISGTLSLADVFANSKSFICKEGGSYTSLASDNRMIEIDFYDNIVSADNPTPSWRSFPKTMLSSVPWALSANTADKLGGKVLDDFLLKAGLPTCSVGQFLSWSGTELACASVTGAAGGTVTSISTGAGLTGGPITGTGTISLNQELTGLSLLNSNGFIKRTSAGGYTASNSLNLTTDVNGKLPVTSGGTGQSSYTDGQLLIGNSSGNTLTLGTLTAGSGITITNGNGSISIASTAAGSLSGDVTGTLGATVLASSGVSAGTFTKVTVDVKGRVTAGTNPSTLSGLGITDAVKSGGVGLISAGNEIAKPAPATKGDIYVAQDTNKIFHYNGSTWATLTSSGGGGTGTVTSVSAGTGLTGGTITGSGSIGLGAELSAINNLSTTGILKRAGSGFYTASPLSLSNGSSVNPISPDYTGVLPVAHGGTGTTSFSSGQLLIGTSTGTLTATTLTAGSGINITNGNGSITIASTAVGTLVGDVSGSLSSNTVGKLNGVPLSGSPTLAGQTLRYDGTNWTPNYISMADLRSKVSGAQALSTGCTSSQTLTWNSATDSLACSDISIASTKITGLGTLAALSSIDLASQTTGTLSWSKLPTTAMSSALGLAQLGTDPSGLTSGDKGKTWFNTATGQIKYWDGTVVKALGVSGAGLQSLNGQMGSSQTFQVGTNGTDFAISSSADVHTFNIPSASASNRGLLTSTDWSTFNNKLSSSLGSGQIFVGSASNSATAVTMSGDATISNVGSLTINNNVITNDKIAGISIEKISSGSDKYFTYKPNNTACANNDVLSWDNSTLRWKCAAPNSASGSVTSIATGAGLSGGPITSTGTISLGTELQGLNALGDIVSPSPRQGIIYRASAGSYSIITVPSATCSSGQVLSFTAPTGGFSCADLGIDASAVGAGTFAADRIPTLDASKVATGTFATAQIPSLDASIIATGTILTARLPAGATAWSVSGTSVYIGAPSPLVGIGTTNPVSTLNVQGAIVSNKVTVTGNAGTFTDFIKGNVQVYSNNDSTINLCGLKDGGTYTLILNGLTAGTSITVAAYPTCTVIANGAYTVDLGAGATTFTSAGTTNILSLVSVMKNDGTSLIVYGVPAVNYNAK